MSRKVKVWTESAAAELQGCLDCTDWTVFVESADDIDEMVDAVSSYVWHCEDIIISTKHVKVFPNNKLWLSNSVRHTLHKKQMTILHGSDTDRAKIKKEARLEIKRAELQHKDKTEGKFYTNNLKEVWNGMRTTTGQKNRDKKPINISG